MTEPNNNETDDLLQRMEREFGPRRPREGERDEPPPPPPPPDPRGRFQPPPSIAPQMIAPPRRNVPQARASMVLLGLIVVIYLASVALSGSFFQPDSLVLLLLGAKENSLIAGGEYWRLLTATFLHANLIHIFFNGYALYSLGPESERIYGLPRFLALYFVAGLGGSVASYALSPSPAVGASGAIFGLIGGLGIFYYLSRGALGEFGRNQVQGIVAIAMINLFIGFASPGVIDNWGHLGGLVAGALAGLALAPRLSVDETLFPPVLVRRFPPGGWAGVGALLAALVAAALLIPPAM